MSSGWVAGSVRARALSRGRLGFAGARALAARPSLPDAVSALAETPYGRQVRPGMSLPEAQHAVGATLLWNLRVLAGWLPQQGGEALRVLAGWFELANLDEHLRDLDGAPAEPPYRLGRLATAWPRLAGTTSRSELRAQLTASGWGDPGGESLRVIQLATRLSWAGRVVQAAEPAEPWALGGAALLLVGELFGAGRPLPEPVAAAALPVLGTGWSGVRSLPELARRLPAAARWVLSDVDDAAQLWRAEARWWSRVESDGARLLRVSRFGLPSVIGAVAVLAVDAARVRAALDLAARSRPGAVRLESSDGLLV